MHQRFLPWLLFCACFAAFALRVEAQGVLDKPGRIMVARVQGKATKSVGGKVSDLVKEMDVEQKAKVVTGPDSFVVLSFSNGASTRLGPDSELVIDEFLQDPFPDEVKPATLSAEPTPSRTKLSLNRGELVGDVKTLKRKNDGFTVQTPVGAAGVRGTVFRIVFRPAGTGQATFQLTTASGLVDYAPGLLANVTASGTAKVDVPQGAEISVNVDISINAQGQIVVTVLPPIPSTTAVGSNTMNQVVTAASDIANAVQSAVFSPSNSGPPTGSMGVGGQTTTTNFTTDNAQGTVKVTTEQAAIPAGQTPTSQP